MGPATQLVVSLVLFPVKEWVSASYETGANLVDEDIRELPLWMQGWEEVKLLLLFITAQGTIFWIGYSPEPWRHETGLILSYGFLFFSFAIDFISPVFQRHEGHYSQILKTLVRHPIASLAFGAVFAMPAVIAGAIWNANPDWTIKQAIIIFFSVNVVSIAWAAVAGTYLGSKLLGDFEATNRSTVRSRIAAWIALLAANIYAFGALALAVHHKSQILKCHYAVDISSLGVDRPGLAGLLGDKVLVGVHFDVTIENPTRFDVEIEKNRLEITHDGDTIATTRLAPMRVPAGETVKQRVDLKLEMKPSALRKGLDLIDLDKWRMTLYVKVAKYFEFPIYLLEPGSG